MAGAAVLGRALLFAALALGAAAAAAGAELTGRIELTGKGARGADPSAAVVWFDPAAGSAAPKPATFTVETRGKAFTPRVLAVPRGSKVRFPNRDPILHNAFSVSRGNAFDLGLVGQGPGAEATFGEPGLVRVFCNVHHGMVAYIVVLDTPHFAVPGADGRFHLPGVPAGRGRLTVWHEQAEELTRELTLPAASPLALAVEISRPRVPRHLNKLGKSYGRDRRDRY
jgi:plastocyanin